MDQRLLFALIGALPGFVPAILLYLQRKKELSASYPLGIIAATTAAETSLRQDLQEALSSVRAENKDLRAEIKSLTKRITELEEMNLEIREAWVVAGKNQIIAREAWAKQDEANIASIEAATGDFTNNDAAKRALEAGKVKTAKAKEANEAREKQIIKDRVKLEEKKNN